MATEIDEPPHPISVQLVNICIQWSLRQPRDWEIIEASEWGNFPFKPDPVGGETIDNERGWIYALNVQGKIFAGFDHYKVQAIDDFVRVTVWNDDPQDWPEGTQRAEVWDCHPIGPDATKRGAINTRFRVAYYESEAERLAKRYRSADGVPFLVRPWSQFKPPTVNVRHGIWLGDDLMLAHHRAQSLKAWWSKEWCEHLDHSELDEDGDLRSQRDQGRYSIPRGTKTYYWTTTNQAAGFDTAENEKALATSAGSGSITVNLAGDQQNAKGLILASPSGEPNAGTWPTGDYRIQMDIASIGTGELNMGVDPLSYPSTGGCYALRLSSDLSTVVDSRNSTLNGSGSGTDLGTTGISIIYGNTDWAPSGSTASDRVGAILDFDNQNMMTATSVVFTCDADAFVDGPWTAAAADIPPRPTMIGQAVARSSNW